VAHEQHGAAATAHFVHFAQAFLLEFRVAHRQHFVDDEDVGFEVRGDGEREPHIHAG
jgi:hypothetical protein